MMLKPTLLPGNYIKLLTLQLLPNCHMSLDARLFYSYADTWTSPFGHNTYILRIQPNSWSSCSPSSTTSRQFFSQKRKMIGSTCRCLIFQISSPSIRSCTKSLPNSDCVEIAFQIPNSSIRLSTPFLLLLPFFLNNIVI